jgi:hypothetical protein
MKAALALALALLAPVACPVAAHAAPKTARCVITSAGEKPYSGPCSFRPESKGSFTVDPVGKRLFFPDIVDVEVSLTGPGTAEVRGLTTSGINSRWGAARRSRRDPACWDGRDFRVCVY